MSGIHSSEHNNFNMFLKKFSTVLVLANLVYLTNGDNLDDMYWQPGDIIKCKLAGAPGFFGFKHYMIGGDEPKHVITVLNDGDDGYIEDIHHEDFVNGINRSKCENLGKGSLTREETIERAKNWVGRRFTYNTLRCNCQHWTNFWANGSSGKWYNNQSLQTSASYCPI